MSGMDVRELWEISGESWARTGPKGGRPNQGFGHTLAEAFWAHLRPTHSSWAPYVDFRVHSCRCVGLACHLGPKILVRTAVVCRKCLFSWTWANLFQDVGPLVLVLA